MSHAGVEFNLAADRINRPGALGHGYRSESILNITIHLVKYNDIQVSATHREMIGSLGIAVILSGFELMRRRIWGVNCSTLPYLAYHIGSPRQFPKNQMIW